MSHDSFANPQPPSNYTHHHSRDDSGPMTNEDFRKLLMTPSVHTVREKVPQSTRADSSAFNKKKLSMEAAEKRKERKLYYATLVKESKEKQDELAKKYRDRAKERREKEKTGDSELDTSDLNSTNYRAVAPGFSLTDNAERRRQLIEESKYLGGDLEHTHLVKGLDYALLQRIRSEHEKSVDDADDEDEINEDKELGDDLTKLDQEKELKKSDDEEEEATENEKIKLNLKPKILSKSSSAALAAALNKSLTDTPFAFKKQLEAAKTSNHQKPKKTVEQDLSDGQSGDESKVLFKTKLGRNVFRVLFETTPPKSNDLFLPNRMAYIVDLNEDETDVPITSIRSKADCPNNENNASLTTNDIVINKLTQILSYLRHGKRDAKKLKKKGVKIDEAEVKKPDPKSASLGIYDDIGDYVPEATKKSDSKKDTKEPKTRNYFSEKDKKEDQLVEAPSKEAAIEFIKNINEKYSNKEVEPKKEEKKSGMNVKFDADSYAECYPGTNAEEDVNIDSDEEVDYTKMDLGNKKGPVNRWDFDTNEEYSDYMSNREALPKAAFQYGLKMTDGRKTRRIPGDGKNDKAKLDKEWTQISKLIEKRKSGDLKGDFKKPKY